MPLRELYRPVGIAELALIFDLGLKAFPPRLPEQPIFYPVLNREYAVQIARDWNSVRDDSGYAGYVLRFKVDADYISTFEEQIVGGRQHNELWVPAEELENFNKHILPPIEVLDTFFGRKFQGWVPDAGILKAKCAPDQFTTLIKVMQYSGFDLVCETSVNEKAVFLNAPFWNQHDFTDSVDEQLKDRLLSGLKRVWADRHPKVPFSVPGETGTTDS